MWFTQLPQFVVFPVEYLTGVKGRLEVSRSNIFRKCWASQILLRVLRALFCFDFVLGIKHWVFLPSYIPSHFLIFNFSDGVLLSH